MRYVNILFYVDDPDAVAATRTVHRAYMADLLHQGKPSCAVSSTRWSTAVGWTSLANCGPKTSPGTAAASAKSTASTTTIDQCSAPTPPLDSPACI
jgi:hypothetical protein